MKKNDLILAGSLLLVGIAAYLWMHTLKATGGFVTVTVDRAVFGTYSLTEDREIVIGDGNRLKIADGTAFMEWADCPDGLCTHQGKISHIGETIVCLPNKVVVEVTEGEASGLDSIAG